MWRDLERICDGLNLPFTRPDTFPQNSLLAARAALVVLAGTSGENYCRVYRAEFGEGKSIEEPNSIAEILRELGEDAIAISERAQSEETKSRLREQTDEAPGGAGGNAVSSLAFTDGAAAILGGTMRATGGAGGTGGGSSSGDIVSTRCFQCRGDPQAAGRSRTVSDELDRPSTRDMGAFD